MKLEVGERVRLKKKHPCGEDTWEIIRTGADIKAKCTGCGHVIMMARVKFLKLIK